MKDNNIIYGITNPIDQAIAIQNTPKIDELDTPGPVLTNSVLPENSMSEETKNINIAPYSYLNDEPKLHKGLEVHKIRSDEDATPKMSDINPVPEFSPVDLVGTDRLVIDSKIPAGNRTTLI